jgi:uncharacterized protein (DUF1330 family)
MAVYIINNMKIVDRDAYGTYLRGFMDVFRRHNGEILAVADAPTPVEGEWPHDRTVLLRFPSRADVQRWIESPEYQAIVGHRHKGAVSNVVILEGFAPTASA